MSDEMGERVVLLNNGVFALFDIDNDKSFGKVLGFDAGTYQWDEDRIRFTYGCPQGRKISNEFFECRGNGSGPNLVASTDSIMHRVFMGQPVSFKMVDGYCDALKSAKFHRNGTCSIRRKFLRVDQFETSAVPEFR